MSYRLVLSDAQQYILQIIMNRGVIDQIDFKKVFQETLKKFSPDMEEERISKEFYSTFIKEINESIKYFNIEIQKGVCEITGITFYCMVRLFDSSSIGKMSLLYSPTELKIFRVILSLIIESDEGCIDYNQIVNQINEDYDEISTQAASNSQTTKVPTNREIRLIVEKFINDYWLMEVISMPNMLTLHGRALIELSQYIGEIFEKDILNYCYRCKKLVLNGITCENCSSKYHRACAKEIFVNHKDCLSCKATFSHDIINSLKEYLTNAKAAYLAKYSKD